MLETVERTDALTGRLITLLSAVSMVSQVMGGFFGAVIVMTLAKGAFHLELLTSGLAFIFVGFGGTLVRRTLFQTGKDTVVEG